EHWRRLVRKLIRSGIDLDPAMTPRQVGTVTSSELTPPGRAAMAQVIEELEATRYRPPTRSTDDRVDLDDLCAIVLRGRARPPKGGESASRCRVSPRSAWRPITAGLVSAARFASRAFRGSFVTYPPSLRSIARRTRRTTMRQPMHRPQR